MSTLLAQDVPLPQSRQSPIEAVDNVNESNNIEKTAEVDAEGGPANPVVKGGQRDDADSNQDKGRSVEEDGTSNETDGNAHHHLATGQEASSEPSGREVQAEDSNKVEGNESADGAQDSAQIADHNLRPSAESTTSALDQGEIGTEKGDALAANQSTPLLSQTARAPTPSSRTSTPPLTSGSAPKKFASVNVNKKFLSKTISPAAGSPTGTAKLGSLSSGSHLPRIPLMKRY